MNAELLDALIAQVAGSIEVDAEPLGDGADPTITTSSWIAILGTPGRYLSVGLSKDSAQCLCTIVAGLEPGHIDEDPALVQDLANELANILAGNIWPALEGATGIGLPQIGMPPGDAVERTMRRYAVAGTPGLQAGLDVRAS